MGTAEEDPAVDPGPATQRDDVGDASERRGMSHAVRKLGIVTAVPVALVVAAVGITVLFEWHPLAGVIGFSAVVLAGGHRILRRP